MFALLKEDSVGLCERHHSFIISVLFVLPTINPAALFFRLLLRLQTWDRAYLFCHLGHHLLFVCHGKFRNDEESNGIVLSDQLYLPQLENPLKESFYCEILLGKDHLWEPGVDNQLETRQERLQEVVLSTRMDCHVFHGF